MTDKSVQTVPETFISNFLPLLEDAASSFVMLGDNFADKELLTNILLKLEEAHVLSDKYPLSQISEVLTGMEKAIVSAILDEVENINAVAQAITVAFDWLQSALHELESHGAIEISNSKCSELLKEYAQETESPEIKPFTQSASPAPATPGSIYAELGVVDDPELVFEFLSESRSHIETVEGKIVELEQDPQNADIINEIFRPVHSIKGSAGYLGLKSIAEVSHELETLLDKGRKKTLTLTPSIIDVVLEGFDAIKNHLEYFGARINAGMYGVKDHHQAPTDIGPVVAKIRLALQGKLSEGKISASPSESATEDGSAKSSTGEARKVSKASDEIRVRLEKLDNLVDLVGELVISQSTIRQRTKEVLESDVQLGKDIANLGKITRDMQDQILTLRMVPVRQTFQKMIRLVRDLSRKQNKEVQLTLHGEDTEIDKTMVDELGDPLVHLMRNAIDHGIELPEVRRANGKDSSGHIQLRAYHRGGNIVIEIEDDGKGISKSAVVNKALEKGLIESSSNLTDQQIYSLIFLPGFSTAKQITDVSGRGVGMDVVKKAIDKLRGKIEIESQEGKGSKISLSLPLTLAIIEGMVVQAGSQKYVLPLVSIVESHRPKKEDIFTVTGKGEMVRIRGELLPLARLHRLFAIPDAKSAPENALVIIIESRTKRCCLMVDDLLGQQQIVVKTLGDKLKNVKGISAATILGDGKVGLILDVEAVMELAFA